MIILMLAFARSGGTILNKCLGSLSNTIVLSEINPLGGGWGKERENSFMTVKSQAKSWYDIDLRADDFIGGLEELEEHCVKKGKHLIVRDWSYVNFVPDKLNNFAPPNRLLTFEVLNRRVETKVFAFLRDAIDVWISMGILKLENFCSYYSTYLEAIEGANAKVFKYEKFCESPEAILKEICAYCDLPYEDVTHSYQSFENLNGDVQLKKDSRGQKQGKISPLPRKYIPYQKVRQLHLSKDIQLCNKKLGYSTDYFRNKVLNRVAWILRKQIY